VKIVKSSIFSLDEKHSSKEEKCWLLNFYKDISCNPATFQVTRHENICEITCYKYKILHLNVTPVITEVMVFWNVTPCNLLDGHKISEEPPHFIFHFYIHGHENLRSHSQHQSYTLWYSPYLVTLTTLQSLFVNIAFEEIVFF
jgi:hypothetical protein